MTRLWPEGVPIGVVAATPIATTPTATTPAATTPEEAPPLRFSWQGQTHEVEAVTRQWRVHSDWWRQPAAWRAYYKLTTTSGLLVIIYHDLADGAWYLQRLYD